MKQKRVVTNALIFNLKSASFTSLPSITKLIPPSTITTTSPTFLLIEKISDSNNDSMDMKNRQEQEEENLNFEAHIIVAYAGPPTI